MVVRKKTGDLFAQGSPQNVDCTDCSLYKSSKHVCIWGDGERQDVMIIGEAPGKNEARTGRPFTGEAGTKVLRPVLAEFGLEDAYITNVAKCRPPENRKPEPSEVKACSKYLQYEFSTRQPKFILLLGA